MSIQERGRALFILTILVLVANFPLRAVAGEMIVGVVPQFEKRRTISTWSPILERLSQETGHKFTLSLEDSIAEFNKRLFKGAYHIAYTNPAQFIDAHQTQGYVPLVRSGADNLRGIVVVRRKDGPQAVRELDGQMIALPADAFAATDLVEFELRNVQEVEPRAIYVDSHTTGYIYVAKGLAKAAGGVQRTFDAQRPTLKKMLRVIHQTPDTPTHPIIVHPSLGAELSEQIRAVLLELAQQQPDLLTSIPMRQAVSARTEDYEHLAE